MQNLFRKTKIVCTLGPASFDEKTIGGLAEAGMNIVRLNFSHGTAEQHLKTIETVRKVSDQKGINLAIALDTKGPEIRTGHFENGSALFSIGDVVTVCREEILGTKERFHIACPELFDDLRPGDSILINDGKMKLTVLEQVPEGLSCRIDVNGEISDQKGCNIPGVKLSMPFLSEKDRKDIQFGCRHNIDFIFASFVRRADDVRQIREILTEEGTPRIQIIAKIENQEGFDNLEEILAESDGVMVARGDLGVEIPTEAVPVYQKTIIRKANRVGKPVITATHMLDSMTHNPRCTRAEASDVANAVLDGSDCVMLSSETASGEYPVEACKMMAMICEQAEQIFPYKERLDISKQDARETIQDAIGLSVADTALAIDDVAAVVAFTQGGTTARRISKFRPCVPILAITFNRSVQRQLETYYGVTPIYSDIQNNMTNDDMLAGIVARSYGVEPGKLIILTAGYPTGEGSANMMKIVRVKKDIAEEAVG